MATERSFFTTVAEELREEIRELRRESGASDAVPFLMERVPRRTFKQRFARMTPELRKAWLEKVGQEQAIAMLRGKHAS